jgi:hypothetical protein
MRGLDPRIHRTSKSLSEKMDGRVKPGHDALGVAPSAAHYAMKGGTLR